jgi:hypothetical protein
MRHTIKEQDASLEHRYLDKSGSIPSPCKLVVLVLACAMFALNSCRRDSESHRGMAASVPKIVAAAQPLTPLGPCPNAPTRMLQAQHSATGHHRVFLTWNASLSARGSDPNALGYCLYRTQTAGRAKDCPTKYPKCEQVNVVPVHGTRCVDELVKDNTTYYYVAIGINSASAISTTSEEAIAEVPAAGKLNQPPPGADSFPACRVPVAASEPARH